MSYHDLVYQSGKTYTHNIGLSCCFRQWRATSHCSRLHGYALQVELTFEGKLDERNWIVDFGGLKEVKQWLEYMFDHTTLVAKDDPLLPLFADMSREELINLQVVDAVGCEKFAELIFHQVSSMINDQRAFLAAVTVREHAGNSATVKLRELPARTIT